MIVIVIVIVIVDVGKEGMIVVVSFGEERAVDDKMEEIR